MMCRDPRPHNPRNAVTYFAITRAHCNLSNAIHEALHHLLHQLIPQTGDEAARLDYFADENLFRSSAASFNTADGTIKLLSSNSTLEADLHLNPAGGFLDGQ